MDTVVFKRKFRWTLEATFPNGTKLNPTFVKVNSRPTINIEEKEINFLSDKTWVPGKHEWQSIIFTVYDVDHTEIDTLYKYISTLFDEANDLKEPLPEKLCNLKLTMYDGCGVVLETWELEEAWFSAVNFGELDHSSSECCTIELTAKYKKVKYTSVTPLPSFNPTPLPKHEVTCPSCSHKFEAPRPTMGIGMLANPNIVY